MRRLSLLSLCLLLPAVAAAAGPIDFGGQFRTRYELSNVDKYPAGATVAASDDDLWLRTRINAKGSPAAGIDVFAELQDSREAGGGASTPGTNGANVDLLQGYMTINELWDYPVSLQVGRFKMNYGDQRMISTLEWSNVSRSWDGARLHAGGKELWGDFFITNVGETAALKRDVTFWGLYASYARIERHAFDVYLLGRDRKPALGTAASLAERTIGTRAKGKAAGFDYSGEFAVQTGRRADLGLRAWAAALTAGYSFDVNMKPRIGVEYDFASGDGNATDNKDRTFRSPYPFGHAYQGHADVVGWRNLNSVMIALRAEPLGGVKTFLRYHHFRLADNNDAWYHANNTVTRAAAPTMGKTLGNEIDFFVKTKIRKSLGIWVGYSHFAPGGLVKNTGFSNPKNFAFAQTVLNF